MIKTLLGGCLFLGVMACEGGSLGSGPAISLPLFDGKAVADRYPALAKFIVSAEKYEPPKEEPLAGKESWVVDEERVLQPGMKIKVDMVGEGSSTVYVVPGSGQIDLPLIRSVSVSGKKLGDVKREVEERYTRVYNHPQVVMAVSTQAMEDRRDGAVSVAGRVKKPGEVSQRIRKDPAVPEQKDDMFVAPDGLFLAVMLAGGFEEGAAVTQLYVLRHDAQGRNVASIIVSDWIAHQATNKAVYNVRLRPGDIVVVPKIYPEGQDLAPEWSVIADYVHGRIRRSELLNQLNARHDR